MRANQIYIKWEPICFNIMTPMDVPWKSMYRDVMNQIEQEKN